jgi:hypothetical protein
MEAEHSGTVQGVLLSMRVDPPLSDVTFELIDRNVSYVPITIQKNEIIVVTPLSDSEDLMFISTDRIIAIRLVGCYLIIGQYCSHSILG